MRSGNPILRDDTFTRHEVTSGAEMTLPGTVNKTAILLALTLISALWVWNRFFELQDPAAITPYLYGGVIGGLVLLLITTFAIKASPITAPLYALCEGLALGGISAFYELRYPGLVIQTVALTFGTLACLLVAYRTGAVRATEKFKLGVVAATGAIALLYLVNIIMGLFGHSMGFIHQSGTVGILFSLVVVVVAALNLVLDFDFIERGVANRNPKYMEWYAAFSLLVTLIWLYMEMLRLLSKLRR